MQKVRCYFYKSFNRFFNIGFRFFSLLKKVLFHLSLTVLVHYRLLFFIRFESRFPILKNKFIIKQSIIIDIKFYFYRTTHLLCSKFILLYLHILSSLATIYNISLDFFLSYYSVLLHLNYIYIDFPL